MHIGNPKHKLNYSKQIIIHIYLLMFCETWQHKGNGNLKDDKDTKQPKLANIATFVTDDCLNMCRCQGIVLSAMLT